jgi:16S rRNA (cytosine1402-N4)-methyltransferase
MKSSSLNIQSLNPHSPVLLDEMLDMMNIRDGGKYLDCTFGAGGYSRAILAKADCFLTSLDQDPTVTQFVKAIELDYKNRFKFVQINFAKAREALREQKFDGIVLDLGVSSMQLDRGDRGFSFQNEGALDMRMNLAGSTAAEFINNADEKELADIIYKYGEEVQSRQIAKAIVTEREKGLIETTGHLAKVVREAMHYRKAKIDPATKTFQAIRIHINRELESIQEFLNNLEEMLTKGGRIIIVSFHSLEDSLVKDFFKQHSAKKVARSKYSKQQLPVDADKWLKILTKKPVTPSDAELTRNYRSRSAKLRAAEKIMEDRDVA